VVFSKPPPLDFSPITRGRRTGIRTPDLAEYTLVKTHKAMKKELLSPRRERKKGEGDLFYSQVSLKLILIPKKPF
jgi:hypothetical protein|tara:strand:+ start:1933 stop:2157 length:225 start_codon:yes stop_codon:yes gene_type:complete